MSVRFDVWKAPRTAPARLLRFLYLRLCRRLRGLDGCRRYAHV